ncbi:hypothetical protein SNE40_020710 [Patella caerulea]|uniref:Uncharacterized protein n=1 Tax=Patella caerulea TaxID=87958 RepID=A0AAN8J4W2_PATCE
MEKWRRIESEHYTETRHQNIDKTICPSLLRKHHQSMFFRQNAISGFEATGIYPYNPNRITAENIGPSATAEDGDLTPTHQSTINPPNPV